MAITLPQYRSDETAGLDRLIGRLRFSQLRLLVALERGGSLRSAAAEFHLTQPALSKALKQMETAFGFALFQRTPKGLRITHQGKVLAQGASLLMTELAHVRVEARAAVEQALAVLRIGAPPFVALSFAPRVLGRVIRNDPPVLAMLQEDSVPRLLEALLAGDLDALISNYSTQLKDASRAGELRYEKLYDEKLLVIAPVGHRLLQARSVGWSQLAQEPWILPALGALIREVTDEAFLRAGVRPPKPKVESTSPLTNVKLVSVGLGLAVVPSTTINESAHGTGVKPLRVKPAISPIPVALLYRASSEQHARITSLRKALDPAP